MNLTNVVSLVCATMLCTFMVTSGRNPQATVVEDQKNTTTNTPASNSPETLVPTAVPSTPVPTPVPTAVPSTPVPTPAPTPVPTRPELLNETDLKLQANSDYLGLENSDRRIKQKGPWFFGTCTATKVSGAWMREWLELQITIGVDHVWVADDNPAGNGDITASILKHYERIGYVTIIPPPDMLHPGCKQFEGKEGRHNCAPVKHCFEHASPHVKWLLFADTDEFIFPHNGCSLSNHIKNHCNPDATHIYVRWERFGTNGFETHPNGLMTENFLSSGGLCEEYRPGAGSLPFTNCPECRHSKVIYNTECAKTEHAGWIHWPVNTTDWKARKEYEYSIRRWIESPGNGSNWKHDKCDYRGFAEDSNICNAWVRNQKTHDTKEYTPDCCTAGIGYNHYGTKSMQYYARKMKTQNENKRGFRAALHYIDLNNVLSFAVLRFVRALRKRFNGMGAQVSDNVQFLDLPNNKSCFIESNYVYEPSVQTTVKEKRTKTLDECCALSHRTPLCKAFSFLEGQCTLFVGTELGHNSKLLSNTFQLDASRTWKTYTYSGIPMKDGECGV